MSCWAWRTERDGRSTMREEWSLNKSLVWSFLLSWWIAISNDACLLCTGLNPIMNHQLSSCINDSSTTTLTIDMNEQNEYLEQPETTRTVQTANDPHSKDNSMNETTNSFSTVNTEPTPSEPDHNNNGIKLIYKCSSSKKSFYYPRDACCLQVFASCLFYWVGPFQNHRWQLLHLWNQHLSQISNKEKGICKSRNSFVRLLAPTHQIQHCIILNYLFIELEYKGHIIDPNQW